MTDLEEKAKEYANMQAITSQPRYQIKCAYKDGFNAGAEEVENAHQEEIENLYKSYADRLQQLQTKYDELNDFEKSQCAKLLKENAELKAQIEKMRNCPNCNKKGCNFEIAKRKECIDNNNSLWEWELTK